jgi:hypothetical protein
VFLDCGLECALPVHCVGRVEGMNTGVGGGGDEPKTAGADVVGLFEPEVGCSPWPQHRTLDRIRHWTFTSSVLVITLGDRLLSICLTPAVDPLHQSRPETLKL